MKLRHILLFVILLSFVIPTAGLADSATNGYCPGEEIEEWWGYDLNATA